MKKICKNALDIKDDDSDISLARDEESSESEEDVFKK
jgi:hypothetical protein